MSVNKESVCVESEFALKLRLLLLQAEKKATVINKPKTYLKNLMMV